ncbi:MAG: cyclase [Terriglobia bacterium]|nr:MAG: cyclase [Terriglobia bacterium]
MEFITHHRHAVNITKAERVISVIGGSLLTFEGTRRRSAGGVLLALAGSELIRRGITGQCYVSKALGVRTAPKGQGAETTSVPYELGIRVDRSITINRPRAEVYGFFRNLSTFPQFMKHVESVQETDGNRSHWVVRAPAGSTVEWDAVIHNRIENELVAWRTLPGADVDHAGSVWFKDAPGGRGTEITVELQYNPPTGMLGALWAKLWGEEPTQQIEDDLRSLKQMLEAGEVTTGGQPMGGKPRVTRPESSAREWTVQQASEESFPASDAPAFTP